MSKYSPLDEILNYFAVNANLSTSGQPKPNQFEAIQQNGFQHVINLAMADSNNALPNEGQLVTSLEMNYFHIPVPWQAPTALHLKMFTDLVGILEGSKIWIHCALNMRVSAFIYHYLTQVKLCKPGEAKTPTLEKWEPTMDDIWKEFLKLRL